MRALAEGSRILAHAAFGADADVVFQDFDGGDSAAPLGGRELASAVVHKATPALDGLRSCDVILDTGGGDSFSDIYGLKRLAVLAGVQRTLRSSGASYVMLPQTVGPFSTGAARLLGRQRLTGVDLVFSRDSVSRDVVERFSTTVVKGTDLVFQLPEPDVQDEERESSSRVALNVSGLLYQRSGDRLARGYRELMASTVDLLRSHFEEVVLLPHVLRNSSSDDDESLVGELVESFGDRVSAHVPRDLWDARSVILGCSLVVGSRMHACLNALSLGVPAFALAYSRKFGPLMRDLGWEYSADLSDGDAEVLRSLQLWLGRLRSGELREAAARAQYTGQERAKQVRVALGEWRGERVEFDR